MGYDIYLRKDQQTVQVPRHLEGGTIQAGGSTEAHVSVTYNYAVHFVRFLGEKGIRSLYGQTGAESATRLLQAAVTMRGGQDDDYWAATEGNARHIIVLLLAWAALHPDATWEGD